MSPNETQILESLTKIIPHLSHQQREMLLSFGENMIFSNTKSHTDYKEEDTEENNNQSFSAQ